MIKLDAALRLMRFHRPLPILLILWPTFWGLFLGQTPSLSIIIVFSLGVILMRAAGCVINDYFDRDFDGHIARTQQRPLANGSATPKQALQLFIGLITLAACLLFFLHPLTILLAFCALFLTLIYPLAKRFTHFPQIVLGIAFNFGLIMAYVQVNGHASFAMYFWYIFAVLWTLLYDTEYALMDYQDDLKTGIKSTAVFFGPKVLRFLRILSGLLIALLLAHLLMLPQFTVISNLLTLAITLFLIWQLHALSKSPHTLGLRIFNLHHWLGLGVFLLILQTLHFQ